MRAPFPATPFLKPCDVYRRPRSMSPSRCACRLDNRRWTRRRRSHPWRSPRAGSGVEALWHLPPPPGTGILSPAFFSGLAGSLQRSGHPGSQPGERRAPLFLGCGARSPEVQARPASARPQQRKQLAAARSVWTTGLPRPDGSALAVKNDQRPIEGSHNTARLAGAESVTIHDTGSGLEGAATGGSTTSSP